MAISIIANGAGRSIFTVLAMIKALLADESIWVFIVSLKALAIISYNFSVGKFFTGITSSSISASSTGVVTDLAQLC